MSQFEHKSQTFGDLNLEDMTCVQQALKALSYDPGQIDGKDGPSTRAAVKKFQGDAAINVDGIVGRDTRAALLAELDKRAREAEAPAVTNDSPADVAKGDAAAPGDASS